MSAGYSGTPLAKKLGIREGDRVVAIGAPAHYAALLAPLPRDVTITSRPARRNRFIHLFVRTRRGLDRRLGTLAASLEPAGTVWISWPKKSAGVSSDLDGNLVRSIGLAAGLVDVKVCAVDEVWSALKFVIRLVDR